jgi:hypothetical protein
LPSIYLNKEKSEINEKNRDEFIQFVITELRSYIQTKKEEILDILKKIPNSTAHILARELEKLREAEGIEINKDIKADIYEECKLFVHHLEALDIIKAIEAENNPKNNTYFIP